MKNDRCEATNFRGGRFRHGHAQRDISSLTALHAARRGNMMSAADALVAERRFHKPASPWVARLADDKMEGISSAMS